MSQTYNLKYVLEVLFRRKRWLLFPMIVAPVLAVAALLVTPKSYSTSTTILVQRDEIINPLVEWQLGSALVRMQDRMSGFNEIIYSRTLIDSVIKQLGLDVDATTEEERDKLYNDVRSRLYAWVPGGYSYTISADADNPQEARDLAVAVRDKFKEIALESDRLKSFAAVKFIQNQVDKFQDDTEMARKEMEDYIQTTTLRQEMTSAELLSQIRKLEEDMQAMDKESRLKGQELDMARVTRERAQRWRSAGQAASGSGTTLDAQIQALRAQRETLTATKLESHPQVVALSEAIANLEKMRTKERQAAERVTPAGAAVGAADDSPPEGMALNPEWAQRNDVAEKLERDLEVLAFRQEVAAATMDTLKGEIPDAFQRSAKTRRLETQYSRLVGVYEQLSQRLEHAKVTHQIELAGQDSRYRVLDDARVPTAPSKPNRKLFALGGIAGGIMGGLFLVILLELLDPTFRRAAEFNGHFRYPVLTEIPKIHMDEKLITPKSQDRIGLAV